MIRKILKKRMVVIMSLILTAMLVWIGADKRYFVEAATYKTLYEEKKDIIQDYNGGADVQFGNGKKLFVSNDSVESPTEIVYCYEECNSYTPTPTGLGVFVKNVPSNSALVVKYDETVIHTESFTTDVGYGMWFRSWNLNLTSTTTYDMDKVTAWIQRIDADGTVYAKPAKYIEGEIPASDNPPYLEEDNDGDEEEVLVPTETPTETPTEIPTNPPATPVTPVQPELPAPSTETPKPPEEIPVPPQVIPSPPYETVCYEIYAAECCGDFFLAETVWDKEENKENFFLMARGAVSAKEDYAGRFKVKWKKYEIKEGKRICIGRSIPYHIVEKDNPKWTNAKGISLKKTELTVKSGKSVRIKAKIVKEFKKKKLLSEKHRAAIRYFSDDGNIAEVDETGRVTGKSSGTCYIRVVALNGLERKVKVTVK